MFTVLDMDGELTPSVLKTKTTDSLNLDYTFTNKIIVDVSLISLNHNNKKHTNQTEHYQEINLNAVDSHGH